MRALRVSGRFAVTIHSRMLRFTDRGKLVPGLPRTRVPVELGCQVVGDDEVLHVVEQ